MKLSYAITVCNEVIEIQKLLGFLLQHKRPQDEIVVLFDSKHGTNEVREILKHYSKLDWYRWDEAEFDNHFANWKNKLNSMCTGDYIFQIDADEYPNKYLIEALPEIFEANPSVDAYVVPRINTVEGLTQEHIIKWRWAVNDDGWVNWPDYQWRIYKNSPDIKWKNKVHEVIEGYKTMAQLPGYEDFALYHPKTIKRQEKQNEYYETL
jgi:hypothetical protein